MPDNKFLDFNGLKNYHQKSFGVINKTIDKFKKDVKSSLKEYESIFTLENFKISTYEDDVSGEDAPYIEEVSAVPGNLSDEPIADYDSDSGSSHIELYSFPIDTDSSPFKYGLSYLVKGAFDSDHIIIKDGPEGIRLEKVYSHTDDSTEDGYGIIYTSVFGNVSLNSLFPDEEVFPGSESMEIPETDVPFYIEISVHFDDMDSTSDWYLGQTYIGINVSKDYVENIGNDLTLSFNIPLMGAPGLIDYKMREAVSSFESKYFSNNINRVPLENVGFMMFEPSVQNAVVFNYTDSEGDSVITPR